MMASRARGRIFTGSKPGIRPWDHDSSAVRNRSDRPGESSTHHCLCRRDDRRRGEWTGIEKLGRSTRAVVAGNKDPTCGNPHGSRVPRLSSTSDSARGELADEECCAMVTRIRTGESKGSCIRPPVAANCANNRVERGDLGTRFHGEASWRPSASEVASMGSASHENWSRHSADCSMATGRKRARDSARWPNALARGAKPGRGRRFWRSARSVVSWLVAGDLSRLWAGEQAQLALRSEPIFAGGILTRHGHVKNRGGVSGCALRAMSAADARSSAAATP